MEEPKKQSERDAELDRFWEIDALLPTRKPAFPANHTDPVDLEFDPPARADGEERVVIRKTESLRIPSGRRFIPPHTENEQENRPKPILSYSPDSIFLRRVDLYERESTYRCYEAFLESAKRLREVRGIPCEPVPFFSYVPQYDQLNAAQLNRYLWWRDRLEQNEPLPIDYSYILLYLYEQINLSGILPPKQVQDALMRIWFFYRKTFPQIMAYLAEWICDHALIQRIGPPDCTVEERSDLMRHCVLKEFYLSTGTDDDALARCLLSFASNYDYRMSKFYTDDTRELFDSTMLSVMRLALDPNGPRDLLGISGGEEGRIGRDAYAGAICSYGIRKRIEVRYSTFFHAYETRFLINDLIKYTENHLRAHFGIRSRLGIYGLPTAFRELIDRYCADRLPPRKPQQKSAAKEEPPAYEKLYDLPQKEFSLRDAVEIERRSWDTTQKLVDAFEESAVPEPIPEEPCPAPQSSEPGQTGGYAPYLPFLEAVRSGDAAAWQAAAREAGKLPGVLVEEINTLAADDYGDILLTETEDGGYAVIEEYRSVLDELLKKGEKI